MQQCPFPEVTASTCWSLGSPQALSEQGQLAWEIQELAAELSANAQAIRAQQFALEAPSVEALEKCKAEADVLAATVVDFRKELASVRGEQLVQSSQTETLLHAMCKELGSLRESVRRQGDEVTAKPSMGIIRSPSGTTMQPTSPVAGGTAPSTASTTGPPDLCPLILETRAELECLRNEVADQRNACSNILAEARLFREEVHSALQCQDELLVTFQSELSRQLEERLAQERSVTLNQLARLGSRTADVPQETGASSAVAGAPGSASMAEVWALREELVHLRAGMAGPAACHREMLEEQRHEQAAVRRRVDVLGLELQEVATVADLKLLEAEVKRTASEVVPLAARINAAEADVRAIALEMSELHVRGQGHAVETQAIAGGTPSGKPALAVLPAQGKASHAYAVQHRPALCQRPATPGGRAGSPLAGGPTAFVLASGHAGGRPGLQTLSDEALACELPGQPPSEHWPLRIPMNHGSNLHQSPFATKLNTEPTVMLGSTGSPTAGPRSFAFGGWQPSALHVEQPPRVAGAAQSRQVAGASNVVPPANTPPAMFRPC